MRGVEKDHTSDLLRIAGGLHPRLQTAVGMAHKHVGTLGVCGLKQGVQFTRDPLGVSGFGSALAPAHPRAILRCTAERISQGTLNTRETFCGSV